MRSFLNLTFLIAYFMSEHGNEVRVANRLPAQTPSQTSPLVSPLSFQSLRAFIEQNNIRSIETLLPHIPDPYRKQKNYILMMDSNSRQSASESNPRVILFDNEAHFIFTFNGDASRSGFNKIETIEWDRVSKSYQFGEVEFPDATQNGGRVQFHSNPETCRECHGHKPHPIWEPYFLWPGALGGNDSTVYIGSREHSFYTRYKDSIANSHARYRYLDALAYSRQNDGFLERSETSPNEAFNERLTQTNMQRVWKEINESRSSFVVGPLLDGFAGSCFYLQDNGINSEDTLVTKLAGFLPNSPSRDGMIRAFVTQIQDRNTLASLRNLSRVRYFADVDSESLGRYRDFVTHSVISRSRSNFGPDTTISQLSFTAPLFLVTSILGFDLSQFSLSEQVGSYGFQDGSSYFPLVLGRLIRRVPRPEELFITAPSGLTSRATFPRDHLTQDECNLLAQQSRQVLNGHLGLLEARTRAFEPSAAIPTLRNLEEVRAATNNIIEQPKALLRCITCHQGGWPGASWIPFSSRDQLRTRLADQDGRLRQVIMNRINRVSEPGRMPPSGDITADERVELINWINGIR